MDGPELPEQIAYLWVYWQEIHAGRAVNGMAPNRASNLDILAWQHNTGIRLKRWEYAAVMRVGGAWLTARIEEQERQRRLAEAQAKSKRLH